MVGALTLSILFVVRQQDVSRLFLLSLFIVEPLVTFAGRATLRAGFNWLRRRGYNTRYMLVAGTGRLAQDFADRVEGRAGLGIRSSAICPSLTSGPRGHTADPRDP